VQADELEPEVRYRVTFEQSFEGTLRRVTEYRGIQGAVFDTDAYGGRPKKGQAQRFLPLRGIARVERLP
jgi:hypothetical protein